MLTSDWGSDMCSSDLRHRALLCRDIRPLKAAAAILAIAAAVLRRLHLMVDEDDLARHQMIGRREESVEARKIGDLAHIGRASCRANGCHEVTNTVVAVYIKQTKTT